MAATEKAVEVQQTTTSNRDSEGQQVAGESLSHRAEVFRSKLIEGFQILDCVTEEGREKAPVYNSSDATSEPSLCAAASISTTRRSSLQTFKLREKQPHNRERGLH